MGKKLLDVFKGIENTPPPLWLMRQAGRYLPEYRKVRESVKSFLDLCYNPKLAFEVTMQPIRRFPLDAAILFSDILVVPHALGRTLSFEEGKGPILEPLQKQDIAQLKIKDACERLSPSFETLSLLKQHLPKEVTLIGFCGAPWTVATYMIAGQSTTDQSPCRLFAYQNKEDFKHLLEILSSISADYLIEQIKAGAEVVQIFDSWSGVLTAEQFEEYCILPVKAMVKKIKKFFPSVPIIAFPKGASFHYINYAEKTGVDGVSLDWTISLSFAKEIQKTTVVQGNIDPLCLVSGGESLEKSAKNLLGVLKGKPFIVNLGHGILPQTPIAHVEKLIEIVKG